MHKIVLSIVLSLAILPGPKTGAAELSEDGNGIFFSAVQGFDGQKIYSSVQDTRGAIWFNSDYGLYRFNGHSTEAFPYSRSRAKYLTTAEAICI